MADLFHSHIRAALANPSLKLALDNNAQRRISARLQSYASLPEDTAVMRQRARAVRADVVANLDRYLDRFVAQAQVNGFIVHRAEDAAQAVRIVQEIARQNGVRRIAKSKSMVSEEIGLNPALEAAGMEVVETDLGEYIVQLRGEHPAHIITPAVHLTREDVGRTFQQKLGIPFSDNVATLTSAARDRLRQVFLDADMGISGVNFGVADTGTLCLVTNEGNGRLVTTLPPVHVALMGIERLVPSLDDLALMLYLLPRWAGGQKLSVYVSLIRRPSVSPQTAAGSSRAPDGPRQRHLVLVDNGRQAIRRSPLAEVLYCIRCGSCLNACPVFREVGGHAYVSTQGESTPYSGPIGSVLSPCLFGQSGFGHLARASSLCGACKEACPVDIDLPSLLLRVRAGLGPVHLPATTVKQAAPNTPGYLSWALRFFTFIAASPGRFVAAQRLAGVFTWPLAPYSGWLRLPAFTGWGYSKDLPRPAVRPFRARWASRRAERRGVRDKETGEQTISGEREEGTGERKELRQRVKEEPAEGVDLVARFGKELAALGVVFTVCEVSDLGKHILGLLRDQNITAVQAWEPGHFPAGLLEALRTGGIQVLHHPDPNIRAGLTGAVAGIADSGTLVLPGSPDRPLTASLLPRMHIAVLHARDICERLPQALKLPEVQQAAAVALISGPSRTADIEMSLTVGMHGPAQVFVFCLTNR